MAAPGDKVVLLKRQLASRFTVQWRWGHADRDGRSLNAGGRVNHLADGLVDAARQRWHVRLGGSDTSAAYAQEPCYGARVTWEV